MALSGADFLTCMRNTTSFFQHGDILTKEREVTFGHCTDKNKIGFFINKKIDIRNKEWYNISLLFSAVYKF